MLELCVTSYIVIIQDSELREIMKTIRALRQEQGWTQFELALRVGVQPQAVYLWESGRRVPQVSQMRKLGELFGICSDEIILESVGEPSPVTGRQARAHRHRDEPTPGRDPNGRAVTRGHDASAFARDDP
jgi:transcriptional regulator with XRE-family HTH domain